MDAKVAEAMAVEQAAQERLVKARAADFYAAEHGTDAEVAAAQAEWAAAMKAHVAAVTNLAWAEADAVHEGRMPLSTAR